jgi:hypothetical protein
MVGTDLAKAGTCFWDEFGAGSKMRRFAGRSTVEPFAKPWFWDALAQYQEADEAFCLTSYGEFGCGWFGLAQGILMMFAVHFRWWLSLYLVQSLRFLLYVRVIKCSVYPAPTSYDSNSVCF